MLTNREVFEKMFGISKIPNDKWWDEEVDAKKVFTSLFKSLLDVVLTMFGLDGDKTEEKK